MTKQILVAIIVATIFLTSSVPVFAKENVATRPGLLKMLSARGSRAAIGSGTITSKSATTLTVTGKDNKTYTVNIDANTQLRRRFGGKATLDEFQIGDTVNVIGKWTDEAKTTVLAKLIRNTSIQKRHGVFIGTVENLTTTGFTLNTVKRGVQTVTVGSSAKIVNRQKKTITLSSVLSTHRVRVRGLWDNKTNTITEVTHLKDYSLP